MPNKERYLDDLIEDYLDALQRHNRGDPETTIPRYRRIIKSAIKELELEGLGATPAKIGEDEIDYLLHEAWGDLEWSTRRWQTSIINGWLRYKGNDTIEKMLLSWPEDMRPNVDYVSPEEAIAVLDAAEGVERIVVHQELRLWLRRCEVRRSKVTDVGEGYLEVLGKGRCGGKHRTIAWAPETCEELMRWADLRNTMIEQARTINPKVIVPESLAIWRKGGTLGSYHNTALDNMILRVGEKAGISRPLTHHMLRRGGARIAYLAGTDLYVISEGLGHRDEKTTRLYLCLTIDDQASGQKKSYDYLMKVRKKMAQGCKPRPFSPMIMR